MKIQEMKSGILHLHRKMQNERRENVFEMRPANDPAAKSILPSAPESELDESRWSVVSFDRQEGSGLTYDQASALISDLDTRGVAGLCIVTDDAAARVRP